MCEDVARTVHIARQLGEPLPIDRERHRLALHPLPERLRTLTASRSRHDRGDDAGQDRVVRDRQPGPLRARDARAGRRAVARRSSGSSPTGCGPRSSSSGSRSSSPPDQIRRTHARRHVGRRLRRGHRLDAHLLPGEDVDRRVRRAAQAAAAPAHPGQPVPAVVDHRHGLHEPQPGRARRPRARAPRRPRRRRPHDRRRSPDQPRRRRQGHRLGAGRARVAHDAHPAAGPVRRQHALRRRHRRGQDRRPARARDVGRAVRRQRPRRRRRRRDRRGRRAAHRRVRGACTTSPPSCAAAATGTSRLRLRREDRDRPAAAAHRRRLRRVHDATSRTSAGCASSPASPSSG